TSETHPTNTPNISILNGGENSNTEAKELSDSGRIFSMRTPRQEEAVSIFGKTYDWNETGYVLTDGTKLDFSGKNEGGPAGHRALDHRDILPAFGEGSDISGTEAMIEFMREGNIRIMPEVGGINLSVKPTREQMEQLSSFVSKNRGEVVVDIDDLDGNTLHSIEYPRGTHANRVFNDLRGYFDAGTIPTITDAQRFHSSYSIKTDGQTGRDDKTEHTEERDILGRNEPAMHVDAEIALRNAEELARVKEENKRYPADMSPGSSSNSGSPPSGAGGLGRFAARAI
ncbi:MAG: hypothetical protein Q4C13_04730, partial [Clostridia bacterium]|nr:hypothetical protein [Clostridia bacterium]